MLKIVKDNVKTLREKSVPVSLPLSEEDLKIALSMVDYIKKSQDDEYAKKHNIRSGVGLAAPQIGINKRMYAVYYTDENEKVVQYALINPKIISSSVKYCALEGGEGCLSVDEEHKGFVYRPYKITIKAYDAITQKDITIVAKNYDAVVLQHELDHLDGILYYDRINQEKPFEIRDNSKLI